MKSFLQEYGITTVVAVVIMSLTGTALVFRDTGGESLKGFLNNFQEKAQIETADAEPSGPIIKTATYQGIGTIEYEEGMTWQEWLDSSYGSGYMFYNGTVNNGWYGICVGSLDQPIIGNEECTSICFVAGTQIQIDMEGHTKNIEDIVVGDQVVSWDVDEGVPYVTTVDKTWKKSCSTISTLTLSDGTVTRLTPNHPLLVGKTWRSIDPNFAGPLKEFKSTRLYIGDEVTQIMGKSAVINIETATYDEPVSVYNLSVISNNGDRNNNNYIANRMIAHNYSG